MADRESWSPLSVRDNNNKDVGHWTLIFDEGLGIRLHESKANLIGLFRFFPEDENCDIRKAKELPDGKTGCVRTETSETFIGWYTNEHGEQGCFSGKLKQKVDSTISTHELSNCDTPTSAELADLKGVPANYSTGDPFLRPDLMLSIDKYVPIQGDCGACYAIASVYSLAKRYALHNPGIAGADLDRITSHVTDCSMYNQGCGGGYPFLTFKWLEFYGAPWYKSHKIPGRRRQHFGLNPAPGYCSDVDIKMQIDENLPLHYSFHTEARSFRVMRSDFVGGCYGCTTEELIRKEIYDHGPVVAAIDMPASLLNYDGESIVGENHPTPHKRLCDPDNLSGWEYTNHAVVLVGFGIDPKTKTPYWIAKNSWGPSWGREGYFKVIRGIDFAGVENQAAFGDPTLMN